MLREILRAKIHRAVVTDKRLDYEGSIGVPREVCEKAGVTEGEKVLVANITNGERFETYVHIWDEKARFCLQGAAGRKGEPGDVIILMFFALAEERETKAFAPRIVRMSEANEIVEVTG